MLVDVSRALGTDYYAIEELLTGEEWEIRDRVRAFCEKEVIPVIGEYLDRVEFPFALHPKLAELNIMGGTVEGYGCPGMSEVAFGLVAAELARGDESLNTFYGGHSALAMSAIAMLGSEERYSARLPRCLPSRRRRGLLHIRGNGHYPVADRGTRDHGCLSLHQGPGLIKDRLD
jgi:glutaryl-CoA dehydrogenase